MQTIQLEIEKKDVALCALTETWIKEDDNLTPLHICASGYISVSIPRSRKQEEDLPWYIKNPLMSPAENASCTIQ